MLQCCIARVAKVILHAQTHRADTAGIQRLHLYDAALIGRWQDAVWRQVQRQPSLLQCRFKQTNLRTAIHPAEVSAATLAQSGQHLALHSRMQGSHAFGRQCIWGWRQADSAHILQPDVIAG